ncbi:hypothetical protein ANCDUO_03781 [Ancylostoma duodenale]|uniref:RING-type E3 ubiquitin transferase n=2 Tax=Ancylostoma duodenale TaxID=51022 RepID=A0A0C2D885_9BILA|nr:hypothetical protein ANCDUO_03781 [Ancylostoma duodenale]
MAPAGQGLTWSDVLCCVVCNQLFDHHRAPVNLTCGHVVCTRCVPQLYDNSCPEDQVVIYTDVKNQDNPSRFASFRPLLPVYRVYTQSPNLFGPFFLFDHHRAPVNLTCGHVVCTRCVPQLYDNSCPEDQVMFFFFSFFGLPEFIMPFQCEATYPVSSYPINAALLSIVTDDIDEYLPMWNVGDVSKDVLSSIENALVSMAQYLHRAESERGGTVFSEILSRTMQRKLVSLLCFQIVEEEGRSRALKTSRAIAERIMTELLLSQQNSGSLSTHLWTAVRARGCQFLGPAMQEDVLKLILLALDKGALIARKTLVMYVVQMLSEDYPQVSKTCVGHVVQLLYRASCFNVLKRDGESSLMQLKDEFRSYESLRREHDAQIVQIVFKLPTHMCKESTSWLLLLAERISWNRFADYIDALYKLIKSHAEFTLKRNEQRARDAQRAAASRRSAHPGGLDKAHAYKTKMCKDISARRLCPRGARCTYAHSIEELRDPSKRDNAQGTAPSQVNYCSI